MALLAAVQESLFLGQLVSSLGFNTCDQLLLYKDNKGELDLAKKQKLQARTKHIDIRHHFLKEHVSSGNIALKFCPTKDVQADMLTKPLGITDFLRHWDSLGMIFPSK